MKIAICDADYDSRAALQEILRRYQGRSAEGIQTVCFENAQLCLDALEQDAGFDLLFSEIFLPDMTGIEAARRLRRTRPELGLIFVTSSRDHALDAYGVNAGHYFLKPVQEEAVFAALDELQQHAARTLLLPTNNGLKKMVPQRLVWGEVQGHDLLWHFWGGETAQSRCTIQQAMEMVKPYGTFVQVHRSFFVNMEYVSEVRRSDLSLQMEDGAVLYIPKTRFAGFYRMTQDFYEEKIGKKIENNA